MIDSLESSQQPAYTPVKCVVCNGFGTLSYGRKTCPACEGKAYILVPNKIEGLRDGKRLD